MARELLTYIPLNEATRRYCVGAQALTQMVEKGTIRAVKIKEGLAVAEADVRAATMRDELWARVNHLDGKPIGVNEAASRYQLSTGSLTRWVKAGYIRVVQRGDPKGGRGRKTYLNEGDVAYAKLVSDKRQSRPGRRVFTREFLPVFAAAEMS